MCHFLYGAPVGGTWCPRWSYVGWNTGPGGYVAPQSGDLKELQEKKIGLMRGQLTTTSMGGEDMGLNSLLLSVTDLRKNVYYCGKHQLNNCQKQGDKGFYLILGVEATGVDTKGLIRFNLLGSQHPNYQAKDPVQTARVRAFDSTKISYSQQLQLATGYSQKNTWLLLIQDAAHKAQKGNCIVCAQARPNLILTETAFEYTTNGSSPATNSSDINCLLQVMSNDNLNSRCAGWDAIFPVAPQNTTPPIFQPTMLTKVTCFNNGNAADGHFSVGRLSPKYCVITYDLTGVRTAGQLLVNRADVWWYCGGDTLRGWLPVNWRGRCALVSLLSPIQVVSEADWSASLGDVTRNHVRRRSVDLFKDSPVWIDAIGIPRGVPDEYKLANQVAAGFESIFIWITPNKNVDRINYIHYNVQRLSNLTRDGFEAVHGQLSATSLVAYQNRLALDMVLAKVGGACSIIGDACCSFIPNNTAPDGSLTKAIRGLQSLSKELNADSGIENKFTAVMEKWFGKWGSFVVSIFSSSVIVVAMFAVCACCCGPCLRALFFRCVDKALGAQAARGWAAPLAYQMSMVQSSAPLHIGADEGETVIRLLSPTDNDV
ncbi:uncharacterized protein LOC118564119 [Fundulus heteroclitus]|uniref:uncharacterized protein LOC118564119 n=1 Tax=Fundulus heteroclitus TaxID=8078 RepID=UPI00165C55F8|nr:uncharacterized protein LOC118564119 [Fundulus heteroclitus]XP_035996783.1 uncharacterized protein LOC118564119 [Fundulus heteroclitus]